jgi:polyisoprenoid-binding protein YceI
MQFASTGVHAMPDGRFHLMGDLTIKGVTRPVTFEVEAAGPVDTGRGMRVGFHATTTINRRDFNITWGGNLPNGTPSVADEVQIVLDAEGVPAE